MDRDTSVFQVSEAGMRDLVLFRRKRQATSVMRKQREAHKDKRKDADVDIALAHSRTQGFKWCVTEGQSPIRRK